jgi:hypothetical protein
MNEKNIHVINKNYDSVDLQDDDENALNQSIATELEKAVLENFHNDNLDTREKLFQELLFSNVLVSLSDHYPKNEVSSHLKDSHKSYEVSHDPDSVNIAIFTNNKNLKFVAAFTNAECSRKWKGEDGYYANIRGQDLFKTLENSPVDIIVINPSSSPYIVLSRDEFMQLAFGVLPKIKKSPVYFQTDKGGKVIEPPNLEISFPENTFSKDLKEKVLELLKHEEMIEMIAYGALHHTDKENYWKRVIFIKYSSKLPSLNIQKLCRNLKEKIIETYASNFEKIDFEVANMPDKNFWSLIKKKNLVVYEKGS